MQPAANPEIADPLAPRAAASRVAPAPKRILIKAVNWLGDLVMSLPAMRAVRRAYPDAHLAILIKKELASFFDGASWINEVIPYSVSSGLGGLNDRRKIIAEIRLRRFDLAVLMPNSFESALWMTAARVPRRAGYAVDARGAMLTHKAAPPRDALDGHQVFYWLAMVRETLGIEGDADDLAISADAAHLATMRKWLAKHRRRPDAPLIALAPAAAYGPSYCSGYRWNVKTGQDPQANQVNLGSVTPTTVGFLTGLPPQPSLPDNSRLAPVELTQYQITGTIVDSVTGARRTPSARPS